MSNTKSNKKSKLKLAKTLARTFIVALGRYLKESGLLDTFWATALVMAMNYIVSRIFNSVEKRMEGANPTDVIDKPPSSDTASKESSEKNDSKEKSEPSKPKA